MWTEKECMVEVLGKMRSEGFQYVEYVAWVKLDPKKETGTFSWESRAEKTRWRNTPR